MESDQIMNAKEEKRVGYRNPKQLVLQETNRQDYRTDPQIPNKQWIDVPSYG